MAQVQVTGDDSWLSMVTTTLTGPNELDFRFGSWRSSPEERRVATVWFTIGGIKDVEIRWEFTDATFIEHALTGGNVWRDNPSNEINL